MKAILLRIWRLTMLAATGPGAWKRAGLYGFVLSLEFLEIWFGVQMIKWSKAFYDALEQLDAQAALYQVGLFFVIVAAVSVTVLVTEWYKKSLRIDLRQHLTERAVNAWLHSGAYWLSRPGLSPLPIENPDQRIAEDCKQFVDQIMMFTIDIISKIVGLVTYLTMLWTLADFPLSLAFIGIDAEIPRYMVWTAFIYVALSSWLTHRLGYPLKNLNFRQEMREADFRHALVQVRDGADQIAQSGGEAAEQRRLEQRFSAVRENWFKLIRRDFVLGMFTVPYYRTVLRIPTFLAAPAYFGGAVTLGGMMQLSSTFSSVTTSLSWFIFNYSRLADFVAVTERLEGLFKAANDPLPSDEAPRAIARGASQGGRIAAEGLRLFTPQGRALDPVPDFSLDPGERVWISGASGQGKTTFLSALKGLWHWGEGKIELPPELTALPQLAAPFGEGILPALTYPEDPALYDRKALEIAMVKVGLGHRIPGVGEDGPAALQGLSMGERQRLALARVLVQRPKWLLLDEPTSALDPASETEILALLRAELPETTILCVAHRPPQGLHPWRRLHLGGSLDSSEGAVPA